MDIKRDWRLIAISIGVGSIITITYDGLESCFISLFDPEIHSFICDFEAPAKIFTGLIAFLVGMVYLKIFMRSDKKRKKDDGDKLNPES